jgi:hypothetical protein
LSNWYAPLQTLHRRRRQLIIKTDADEYIFDGEPSIHLVPLGFACAGATTCTSLSYVGSNAQIPFHKTLTLFCIDRHVKICGWTRVFPVTFDEEEEEIDTWEGDSSIGKLGSNISYAVRYDTTSEPLRGFSSALDVPITALDR